MGRHRGEKAFLILLILFLVSVFFVFLSREIDLAKVVAHYFWYSLGYYTVRFGLFNVILNLQLLAD